MKIIDSVAAVFCYQGQVFAVRRQSHLQSFPGYDSFPGGKIDQEDSATRHPARFLCDLDGQSMHALVREIDEELGYDLPAGIASGQVSGVKCLATALAPAIVAVRFRLHFFRIDLRSPPSFSLDAGEIADGFWKTAHQLLVSHQQGDSLMVPPLRWMLERLQQNPQGYDFGDLSPKFDEDSCVPSITILNGVQMLPIPSNTFPPVKRTNAFLLGDEGSPRILVDPSPESQQVMNRVRRTLQHEKLTALFLTHHHLDHHEYAPELARQLNIPIWMSEDTRQRIAQQQGADYFAGVSVEIKRDADSVTRWQGEKVLVYSVPGHDAGQLALAPESLRWFLVGDLMQSTGPVVISAPEGNMAAYFQTLERIIALSPEVIFPSHGMPMRGTFHLQATLRHRREREKVIQELFTKGKSQTEILNTIYKDVDRHLLPFALKNIESHLEKLQQEARI